MSSILFQNRLRGSYFWPFFSSFLFVLFFLTNYAHAELAKESGNSLNSELRTCEKQIESTMICAIESVSDLSCDPFHPIVTDRSSCKGSDFLTCLGETIVQVLDFAVFILDPCLKQNSLPSVSDFMDSDPEEINDICVEKLITGQLSNKLNSLKEQYKEEWTQALSNRKEQCFNEITKTPTKSSLEQSSFFIEDPNSGLFMRF